MSTYTPNLGLEKPEPSEFYDVGVFNKNADKIDDAVPDHNTSPAAHPYTNEKLSGVENVGEALTALTAGKVTIVPDKVITLSDVDSFDNLPMGYHRIYGMLENAPVTNFNGCVITLKFPAYRLQIACEYSAAEKRAIPTHLRDHGDRAGGAAGWSTWRKFAMVTPDISWVTFPYTNGYTGEGSQGLTYSKSNLGIVHLNGIFSRNAAVQANQVIGVLPVGYRPTRLLSLNASIINTLTVGVIHLTTSGTLVWNSQKIPIIEANQKIQIDVRFSASS